MKYDELIKRLRCKARLVREYNDTGMLEDEAADAIEELQKPKWIPVAEKLPYKSMWCLVICNERGGRITRIAVFLADYYGDIFEDDGKNITKFVTHWMPLPEPPKDGEY